MVCKHCPSPSKTTKVTATNVVSRSLTKPITCFNLDIVGTYKKIVELWPDFKKPTDKSSHPFFLTSIKKFKASEKVWFKCTPIGRNTILEFTKVIANDVLALSGKKISNKTGRGVGITHLNEGLVFIEKAMEATKYCDIDVFEKYNQEKNSYQNVPRNEFSQGNSKMVVLCYIMMPTRKNVRDMRKRLIKSLFIYYYYLFNYLLILIGFLCVQQSSSYGDGIAVNNQASQPSR